MCTIYQFCGGWGKFTSWLIGRIARWRARQRGKPFSVDRKWHWQRNLPSLQTSLSSGASSQHSICVPRTLFSWQTTLFAVFLCTSTLLPLFLRPTLLDVQTFPHPHMDNESFHISPAQKFQQILNLQINPFLVALFLDGVRY